METVKKANRCFLCLGSGHRSSECQSKPCDIDGCGRRHNKLLHRKSKSRPKQEDESKAAEEAASMLVSSANGAIPVVKIRLANCGKTVDTYALCDSGSSVSFMDQTLQEALNLSGCKTKLSVMGFNGSKECPSELVEASVSNVITTERFDNVKFYVNDKICVGSTKVNVDQMKRRFRHINVLPDGNYSLNDVKVILGQECYDLHRPLEYRKPDEPSTPWAIRTKLGWALSGPLPQKEMKQLAVTSSLANAEDHLSEQVKKWWDIESYA